MYKYSIVYSSKFKKSFKKLSNKDQLLVIDILKKLSKDEKLEEKHKDHQLKGKLKDFRDCHIKPDLVLIYQKNNEILELLVLNIGSHSDLF
ncbi:toxin-antitoxin system, toxin component, YafQ family [Campylobacter blaseri]|uniref:Type II toxin-antitoxin system mRNA interferase toxin, RelE/StbE family n=1 Tax=Campylobacter blaseri TaxID=2042961 RepID=A0A2P8R2J8_9BACT|nr:type II toxin-antitoxin system YafQ family toxin [Campylobacter blaseri]PSM52712.1 type II toxin-antitoxin system mRNA interferase toxin, RelE/StbE family [Campylobacter blaseri]PSM54360.1 type II toxin-antitoxin system mRNA interferase toxin, RelE/StbE family [Campylobacter blaseri]QKF86014.1 toxin-antitoxin system, toxin component, YafQ family [Campylobacter blaseri]